MSRSILTRGRDESMFWRSARWPSIEALEKNTYFFSLSEVNSNSFPFLYLVAAHALLKMSLDKQRHLEVKDFTEWLIYLPEAQSLFLNLSRVSCLLAIIKERYFFPQTMKMIKIFRGPRKKNFSLSEVNSILFRSYSLLLCMHNNVANFFR